MRVALIVHSATVLDEGVRIVGENLRRGLQETVNVESFTISSPKDLLRLRWFHPDVCHFVLSYSSWSSVIIPWIVARVLARSKFCVSAVQPRFSDLMSLTLRFLRPDHAFVQSNQAQESFRRAGVENSILWHGVDLAKFRPINKGEIRAIRQKWGIPFDTILIAHVGAISEGRGVRSLIRCAGDDRTVFVVGRETTSASQPLLKDLIANGIRTCTNYVSNIEEIYQMCDLYVFPTEDPRSAIDMPLSIIEAASSGCRVVSVDFRGVPLWVRANGLEGDVVLVKQGSDIPREVERLSMEMRRTEDTSRPTLPDWSEVSRMAVETYWRVTGMRPNDVSQNTTVNPNP